MELQQRICQFTCPQILNDCIDDLCIIEGSVPKSMLNRENAFLVSDFDMGESIVISSNKTPTTQGIV